MTLNELEVAVLQKLLAGEHPVLEILRKQVGECRVTSREYTGVGFFTQIALPDDAPRVEHDRPIRFGNVVADFEGLQHGAGFVLFIDAGVATCLEGYTFDEPWPPMGTPFQLRYEAQLPGIEEELL